MSDGSRRFTDKEVALVLRKAAEIDEQRGAGGPGGLSVEDLREIAREVGISPDAIDRAVAGLDGGGRRIDTGGFITGASAVHKASHAVQGELNEAALNKLLHIVDERMESNGAVTEALGSVRWTSTDRFTSTQVAVTPQGGETSIQVTEKILPRWKRIMHAVPAAWGLIIGTAVVDAAAAPAAAEIMLLISAVALGLGAGRVAWTVLTGRSERRVQQLAADLSREAYNAAKAGMIEAPSGEDGSEPA